MIDPIASSPEIGELAKALAKAQAMMESARKDSVSPQYKSKYANLTEVWKACRKPLTQNGLSVIQLPKAQGNIVTLETVLLHESGQWVSGSLTVHAKDAGPQSIGSAITYMRRYSLMSIAGVDANDADDDDGHEAQGNPFPQPTPIVIQKAADKKPAPPPSSEIYSGSPEQAEKVKSILIKMGIAEEYWEEIHHQLINKPGSELKKIIQNVVKNERN